jgi:hypothetical protein
MRIARLVFAATTVLAWNAHRAAAQSAQDFASCSPTLSACDQTTNDCCYRPFDPVATDRAIIIPLDRCHQVVATSGKYGAPSGGTAAPTWCSDPGTSADNGMYEAYGLVYRLMQRGIKVYWLINPTKDVPALTINENASSQTYIARDVDFWVLAAGATPPSPSTALANSCTGACVPPVLRLNPTTLAPVAGSYTSKRFPVRGGAFVIAAEDRPAFNEFWKHTGAFSSLAGNSYYDFTDVDLYEVTNGSKIVYQDFRTVAAPDYGLGGGGNGAPVAVRIDYAPPRLARQYPAGVSAIWLGLANLDEPATSSTCKTGGAFTPADAVYCNVTLDDIGNGDLISGKFQWAWLDNWNDNSPCGDATEKAQVAAIETFMTHVDNVRAGGHVVFMEAIIGVMEKCTGKEVMGVPNVGLTAGNNSPNEPLILRSAGNVFMQWGDLPTSFAQGSVTKWNYWGNGAAGYASAHLNATTGTLVRLVSEDRAAPGNAMCSFHKSTPACDVFANNDNADNVDVTSYLRYQDDPENGIAFYMPGNQVNNGPSQLRMILDTLISLPLATVPQPPSTQTANVTRSSPTLANVGNSFNQYQGSYVAVNPAPAIPIYNSSADANLFEFPYLKGHFYGAVAGSSTTLFDAATAIPGATATGCGTYFTAGCRTVFTNAVTGRNPARVFLATANRTTLKPLIAPGMDDISFDLLISHLLSGHKVGSSWLPALGGIDRSTAAVIEPSTLVGGTRPTMAYVGASDGMLHAFCVDRVSPCNAVGQELWAFAPRTILQTLRYNSGRVDGSPKVTDVFGNFAGNGIKTWKTVLTFQVGDGSPGVSGDSPAVYALDISNPANPSILWEYAPPATRGTFELGVGINLAMGPVQIAGTTRNFTFAETNNGGTGSSGVFLVAIDTETGLPAWTWTEAYPAPRTTGDTAVPSTGIPGGVAAIDLGQTGYFNSLAVPSLYGEVWLLNAATGTNKFTSGPLFTFATDYHPVGAPPTVYYKNGQLALAITSGGYVDPIDTSWAPAAQHQYVVSFSIAPTASAVPIADTGTNTFRHFTVDLGAGQRVYGQAVVSGNDLFVVSDTADVNDPLYNLIATNTARLSRISLATGATASTAVILQGAAAVDVQGGVAYTGNGASSQKMDYSASYDPTGKSTELGAVAKAFRQLWIRTQ